MSRKESTENERNYNQGKVSLGVRVIKKTSEKDKTLSWEPNAATLHLELHGRRKALIEQVDRIFGDSDFSTFLAILCKVK